eukprot:TRINITY_DN70429_c0_g1_i1.p1 TRINITY_DN70429_c0_g1~~TRINITY_DN70429_c0_g1_i1.p1  ORF type:complete len:531 (+),score=159.13 TRINITY_DN70429_c0_g1_i1:92-1684(+)
MNSDLMGLRQPLVLFLLAAGTGLLLRGASPSGPPPPPLPVYRPRDAGRSDDGPDPEAAEQPTPAPPRRRRRSPPADPESSDPEPVPAPPDSFHGARKRRRPRNWDQWVDPEDIPAAFEDAAGRLVGKFSSSDLQRARSEVTVAGVARRVEEMRQEEVLRRRPKPAPEAPGWSGICWVIQIIDGKVYVQDTGRQMCTYREKKTGKTFYESFFSVRRQVALRLVQRVIRSAKAPLPNMEFAHCVGDCPMNTVREPQDNGLPVFATTYCGFSTNLPFPQWEPGRSGGPPDLMEVPRWMSEKMAFSTEQLETFANKKAAAVYRGAKASRGCLCNQWGPPPSPAYENCAWHQEQCRPRKHFTPVQPCGRKKLLAMSSSRPDEVDYKEVSLSMKDQARKFQMVVHLEGTCGWADRLTTLLALPMVILKQVNWCGEWYNLLLRPGQHYVPVKCDLSDVYEQVAAVRENVTGAIAMVRRANQYVERAFDPRTVQRYTEALLRAYAKAMGYDSDPLTGPSGDAVLATSYPAKYGGLART